MIWVWLVVLAGTPARAEPRTCGTELVASLVEVEQALYTLVPPAEKYATAPQSAAHEAQIRKELDHWLGVNAGGAATYALECHANVCKVEVNEATAEPEWKSRILGVNARVVEDGDIRYLVLDVPAHARWSPRIVGDDCKALAERLAAAEKRLDALRPLEEMFSGRSASRAGEAEIASTMWKKARYKVACREAICRIELVVRSPGFPRRPDVVTTGDPPARDTYALMRREKLFERLDIGGDHGTAAYVLLRGAFERGETYFAALRERIANGMHACKLARGAYAIRVSTDRGRTRVVGDRTPCLQSIVDAVVDAMPAPGASIHMPERPIRFWIP